MGRRHARAGILASILLFLLGSILLARAADRGVARPDPESPPPAAEPVTLPTNPAVRKKLEAARDYIQSGEWNEGLRLLQGLIDAPEDSFIQRPSGVQLQLQQRLTSTNIAIMLI